MTFRKDPAFISEPYEVLTHGYTQPDFLGGIVLPLLPAPRSLREEAIRAAIQACLRFPRPCAAARTPFRFKRRPVWT
jgi:hypothetical protein